MAVRLQWGQRTDDLIDPQEDPQLYQAVMSCGGLAKIAAANYNDMNKLKTAFLDSFNS
jgi:hypothetical protein